MSVRNSQSENFGLLEWLNKRAIPKAFKRSRNNSAPESSANHLSVPGGNSLLHITHWKAGSQWIRTMLEDAFGPAVEAPVMHCAHFFDNPIKPGAVYPCLYINKYEFECISPPIQCTPFVVIRDLRDTLVSGYFSWRYSHRIEWYPMEKCRRVLNSLSEEAGMIYMLHEFLPKSALMQQSWLGSASRIWKLEDFMGDPAARTLELLNHLGLSVDYEYAKTLSDRHSFRQLSSGRSPGEEDSASHFRKGIAGDWKAHFTPEVKKQFKLLYNDVLIRTGYERDENW